MDDRVCLSRTVRASPILKKNRKGPGESYSLLTLLRTLLKLCDDDLIKTFKPSAEEIYQVN